MTQVYTEMFYLIFVCLLMIGCLVVIAKLKRHNHKRDGIDIISNVSLGAKERLVVVAIDGKKLALGVTPNQITKLYEFETEEELDQHFSHMIHHEEQRIESH